MVGDTLFHDTVGNIQQAKSSGHLPSRELMQIGDQIGAIIEDLPHDSLGRFLGWSYIVALAEGHLDYPDNPEVERGARLMVLIRINEEQNQRFLKGPR